MTTVVVLLLGLLVGQVEARAYRDPAKCGRAMIQRVKRALEESNEPVATVVPVPRGCRNLRVSSPYWFKLWEDGTQSLFEGDRLLVTLGFAAEADQAVLRDAIGRSYMIHKDGRTGTWVRVGE